MIHHALPRPIGRGLILRARIGRVELALHALLILTLTQIAPPASLLLVPCALCRLQDIGVSTRWAAMLALSGPIGWLALLWLFLLPGDPGPNPYGPRM
jgi:uncharacterized membrane protein YhaH (DUF805 family)